MLAKGSVLIEAYLIDDLKANILIGKNILKNNILEP